MVPDAAEADFLQHQDFVAEPAFPLRRGRLALVALMLGG